MLIDSFLSACFIDVCLVLQSDRNILGGETLPGSKIFLLYTVLSHGKVIFFFFLSSVIETLLCRMNDERYCHHTAVTYITCVTVFISDRVEDNK